MKNVKIIIGANAGDEGKGLATRSFVKANAVPTITVLANGTAQRGHTVDYGPKLRHVFHHFGSGTLDNSPTYFADTYMVHPMEFHREYIQDMAVCKFKPMIYCSPKALVITPFDMLVDRATQNLISVINGEREFGSCAYGSWCLMEGRVPLGRTLYTVRDFYEEPDWTTLLNRVWDDCLEVLHQRGIDFAQTAEAKIFNKEATIKNFINDLVFFFKNVYIITFDALWKRFNSFVFENGQGLMLDKNVDNDWHTTSNTGVLNPYNMLKDKDNYQAEVVYVTRSYETRHGIGPMGDEIDKNLINKTMFDKTNVYNDGQGFLRYGYLDVEAQKARIEKDFALTEGNSNFTKAILVTHTNEFDCGLETKYYSDNPYGIKERS